MYQASLIVMMIGCAMSIFTDVKYKYYLPCLLVRTTLLSIALIMSIYDMYNAPVGTLAREIALYRDFYGF